MVIILAFIAVKRKSKLNKKLKYLALLFSLVIFILINYIVPPIQINKFPITAEINNQLTRFEEVEYVKVFNPDSKIQEKIRQYDDNSNIMFMTYILLDKNIPIKSSDWLLRKATTELDLYWYSHMTKSETIQKSERQQIQYGVTWEEYVRNEISGEEYLGVIDTKDDKRYLKYIIKGKMRNDKQPRFPF